MPSGRPPFWSLKSRDRPKIARVTGGSTNAQERPWWLTLGMLLVTTSSGVYLFQAASWRPLTSGSIPRWVIFIICLYGLGQIFEITFDGIIAGVGAKLGRLVNRGPKSAD